MKQKYKQDFVHRRTDQREPKWFNEFGSVAQWQRAFREFAAKRGLSEVEFYGTPTKFNKFGGAR